MAGRRLASLVLSDDERAKLTLLAARRNTAPARIVLHCATGVANQPPWTSIRYSEKAIKESIPEFLLRLWHVYSFFVIYANIDGFDPAADVDGNVGPLDSLPRNARTRLDRAIEKLA